MRTKAIIFDLDGTAVDSPSQTLPTEHLINASQKIQTGYFLCAATGRGWKYGKEIIRALQLKDLCILSAGTQICDPQTGKIIWQKDIEPDALNEAVKIFSENPGNKLIYNDFSQEDYYYGGVLPKDFDIALRVNFIFQSFVPDEIAKITHAKLNKIGGITCSMVPSHKSGCRDLHVVNKNSTKEQAIKELLIRIGIERKDTIGIGDGLNDLHLFNAVGKKVAMGNAVAELKSSADLIIGKVANDGLAQYFEELQKS